MYRLAFAAVVLATGSAAASPTEATENGSPATRPRPRARLSTAYLTTVAATTAPLILAATLGDDDNSPLSTAAGMVGCAALVFGPSAGHWYVGDTWTVGLGLRLGGAALIGSMVIRDRFARLNVGEMIVGGLSAAALWETGVIWDVVTLPRAVRRYNREHALAIVPARRGLAIAGRF